MRPYESYRPTQELWLPSIPEHWDFCKIKYAFQERAERGYPDEPLLVASQNMGVVPKEVYGSRTVEATKDLHLLKLVRTGDFVISLRSFQGGIEYAYYQGIISPAYTVMVPNEIIVPGYFKYLAKSALFIELLKLCVTGIREGQNIDYVKLKNHFIPIPPRAEQEQIVRFLDAKVSRINRLIGIKQKQTAALKELAQAEMERQLCAYPVTKTVRLKQLGTLFKGGGFSRDNLVPGRAYPAILYGDIYTQYKYKTSAITHHIDGAAYAASRKITKGDIVMAGTGETKDEIGKPILYMGEQTVAVGGDTIVFHPREGVYAEYLLYQLYSRAALRHRYINGKGDIIVHIYPTALGDTRIPLPGAEDQKTAVMRIDAVIRQVKSASAVLAEEISALQEYRAHLIADAVTGRVDVRGIEISTQTPAAGGTDDRIPNCGEKAGGKEG